MIPHVQPPFKYSKTALLILVATLFLVFQFGFMTVVNFNRTEKLMTDHLLQTGKNLIYTIESTSLINEEETGESLKKLNKLIKMAVRSGEIAYIKITDSNGILMIHAGSSIKLSRTATFNDHDLSLFYDEDKNIFEISRKITLNKSEHPFLIGIGLSTTGFQKARENDLHHNLIMGGILLLLGTSGLYFLVLYKRMSIAKKTLENMTIYTKNVIDSMPEGLMTLDVKGKVVSSNQKTLELTNLTLSDLHGNNLLGLFPNWPEDLLDRNSTVETSIPESVSGLNYTIPIRISSSNLLDQQGKKLGNVILIKDMQEIHEMQQRLETSRRLAALGQMAAGIAHEIRNPLGTLKGFAHYFGKHSKEVEEQNFSDIMVGEIDRLNNLVSSLLQFAKPQEPNFNRILINDLFKKVKILMKPDLEDKKIKLSLIDNESLTFDADPDLILQVLLNLLKNSLAASNINSSILLEATRLNEFIQLIISDIGQGISPETKEFMFNPFFTTKKEGTGLGLAVVHQIIESHHGKIEVESETSKGTKITLILPSQQPNGNYER